MASCKQRCLRGLRLCITILPIALLLLGNGAVSAHYETMVVSDLGKPFFAGDGALAMIVADRLLYVPAPGFVYDRAIPSELSAQERIEIVALGTGVWLRQGDRFAYASVERLPATSAEQAALSWQVVELPEEVADSTSMAGDGGPELWVHKREEGLWLLTADSRESESRVIHVQTQQGKLFVPTQPAPVATTVAHRPNGCDVIGAHPTPASATTRRLDEFIDSPAGSLCDAWVLNDRGRVWLQSGRGLIAEHGDSWFILASARPSFVPPASTSSNSLRPSWRTRLRNHGPRRLLGEGGLPVAGALMLSASLTAGSFVSREQAHDTGFVRTLGASILAQPMAAALNVGAIVSTSGRGGAAIQKALLGTGVLLSPLPALGAWAGGRIMDDHAGRPGRGLAGSYLGAALGAVISTPLSAWALSEDDGAAGWWFAQLASSALIGFGASLGYALAADLPREAAR